MALFAYFLLSFAPLPAAQLWAASEADTAAPPENHWIVADGPLSAAWVDTVAPLVDYTRYASRPSLPFSLVHSSPLCAFTMTRAGIARSCNNVRIVNCWQTLWFL